MEPKFQTSFIPKKPLSSGGGMTLGNGAGGRSSMRLGVSIYMTVAVIAFIVSIAGIGGAYAWKQYLLKTQILDKAQLVERQKQFNIDLVTQLKQVNMQIDTAKRLIQNHLALSHIFSIMGRLTIANVQFLSFDATVPAPDASGSRDIKVSMHGQGTSLAAVAFQSDVISQLDNASDKYGLRGIVKNPIMSDPSMNLQGAVSFGFSASIDPSVLSYEKFIKGDTNASSAGQTQ